MNSEAGAEERRRESPPERAPIEPAVAVRLEGRRTIVRLAAEEEASEVVRFYTANREHLRPWDPERPEYFFSEGFWRAQLHQISQHPMGDSALRLFIFPNEEPRRIIGNISLSNITRGVAHSCTLGYSLDGGYEGRGLMRDALEAVIEHAFGSMRLHRIEANYMPHNRRSGGLLRRLGFQVEGYSRDYLQIAGRWEDHVRTALINPERPFG